MRRRRAAALLAGVILLGGVAAGQADRALWQRWQDAVRSDDFVTERDIVSADPAAARALLMSIHDTWRAKWDAGDRMGSSDFVVFIYDLAAMLQEVKPEPEVEAIRSYLGVAPRDLWASFEKAVQQRDPARRRRLVTEHPACAYAASTYVTINYNRRRQEGAPASTLAPLYTSLWTLNKLIEEIHGDSGPLEQSEPPEGWTEPPGGVDAGARRDPVLDRAERTYGEALAAEGAGHKEKALDLFIRSADLYREGRGVDGELDCRNRAAKLAYELEDFAAAEEQLTLLVEVAEAAGQKEAAQSSRENIEILQRRRQQGEIPDDRASWERDEQFGDWRETRLDLKPLPSDTHSLSPGMWESPALWRWVEVTPEEPARLALPGEPTVALLGGEVFLDRDGDGNAETLLESGSQQTVSLRLTSQEGDPREMAYQLYHGAWVRVFGVSIDLAGRSLVFYKPAMAAQGRIAGKTVRLLDDTCDGEFGAFGHDGFTVGKEEWAGRLSTLVRLGSKLYGIDPDPDGRSLGYREFLGETARIEVKTEVGVLRAAIVRAVNSSRVFVEVGQARGGAVIPAGAWVLDTAVLTDSKGENRVTVHGGAMEPFVVEAGEKAVITLGRELQAGAQLTRAGDVVTVVGGSVQVVGSGGEVYEESWPEPFLPTFEFREGEAISIRAQMPKFTDAPDVYLAWWPKDVSIKAKFPEKELAVRLGGEHPVLGPIQGAWIVAE